MNLWKSEKDNMEVIEKIQAEIKEELKKILDTGTEIRLKKWYKELEKLKGGKLPCKSKKKR
jgi:hypothetical protein